MLHVAIAFMLMALGTAAGALGAPNEQADALIPFFLAFVALGILSFGVAMLERVD